MFGKIFEAIVFLFFAILLSPLVFLLFGVLILILQAVLIVFTLSVVLGYFPGVLWEAGKILFK